MSISEDIFFADSEAVLEILQGLERDGELSSRWRLAFLGTDRLLSDCGLDLQAKKSTMERLCRAWNVEFGVAAITKKKLAEKFRGERKKLEALLEGSYEYCPELSAAEPVIQSRTSRVVAAVRSLQALAAAGRLHVDISDLVTSYVHMHINRFIRSSARLHEMVLYDFLFHAYEGMVARDNRCAKRIELAGNQPAEDEGTGGNSQVWIPTVVGRGEL